MKFRFAHVAIFTVLLLIVVTGWKWLPPSTTGGTADPSGGSPEAPTPSTRSDRKDVVDSRPRTRDHSGRLVKLADLLDSIDDKAMAQIVTHLEGIFDNMTQTEFESLFHELQDPEATDPMNLMIFTVLVKHLAAADAFETLDLVLAGAHRQFGDIGMVMAMGAAIDLDFEAARDWVFSQKDPTKSQVALTHFLSFWGSLDPVAATAFLKRDTLLDRDSSVFRERATTLAGSWAAQDPVAAITWVKSLEDSSLRSTLTETVYLRWARINPEKAVESLPQVVDGNLRKKLIAEIAKNWASRDLSSAQTWLANLPAAEQEAAWDSALATLGDQDPEQAAVILDRLTGDAEGDAVQFDSLKHHADKIAQRWARQSPREAADWAAKIPEIDQRATILADLASHWTRSDPAEAARWVDTLPAGKPRDSATGELVLGLRDGEPAIAFEWALTISDEKLRYRSLMVAVVGWALHDTDHAREAIHSADLTQGRRDGLLRQLRLLEPTPKD